MSEDKQKCSKCGIIKNRIEFYRKSHTYAGRDKQCKVCKDNYRKLYQQKKIAERNIFF
jgi:hypothetical protein